MSIDDPPTMREDPETGNIILKTPYNKQFVTDFKAVVPYAARAMEDGRGWMPDDLHWVFDSEYREQVAALVDIYFGGDFRIDKLNSRRRHV